MKKNNIFYACAAAALVFASCQKETLAIEGSIPDVPETSFTDMSVITAKTAGAKVTTQDGVNVLWDKGDKIQLFTRTWNEVDSKFDAGWCDYTTTLDAPSATASFVRDAANTNTVDNTSGKYLAINHKGATVVTQSRDYYAQIALNKEQVAKNGGDFVSTLLYAASENSEFTFSHATAYLKFTVDINTTPFKKLTVAPVNDSEYVVSRIQITFSGDVTCEPIPLNSSSKPYSQSSKTVSVTTDDEAAFAPGTYHIAINTGTYADGLKLTFSNGSEDVEDVVITTPSNVQMKAGDVANLGTIGKLDFPAPTEKFEPSLYVENGENMGVVFWVDPTYPTKGKAVSGLSTEIAWHSSTKTFDDAASFASGDSKANFEYLMNRPDYTANKDKYGAIYFCESLGAGWRLPSKPEVEEMFRTWSGCTGDLSTAATAEIAYTLNNDAATAFDNLLLQCKDNDLGMLVKGSGVANWYWTCQSDATSKKIYRVKIASGYFIGAANATNIMLVRCVRDVEIK